VRKFREQLLLLVRYGISGLVSFGCELVVLWLLQAQFTLPTYTNIALAFALTTIVQWVICHAWVFKRSRRAPELEYWYFFLILTSGLVIATLISEAFILSGISSVLLARTLSGPFTALWDFYLNARFNFRAHPFLRPARTRSHSR